MDDMCNNGVHLAMQRPKELQTTSQLLNPLSELRCHTDRELSPWLIVCMQLLQVGSSFSCAICPCSLAATGTVNGLSCKFWNELDWQLSPSNIGLVLRVNCWPCSCIHLYKYRVPKVVMILYSKIVIKLCMDTAKAQGNTAAFMTV